ncbi:hypothetical protein B0I35DRAFT_482173 [Stachybotrys elegans]|uniref:Uncharacterized protein n=1 Tax=Stachybotrys elegans TaxID=80388 RepID=A0A8K0SNY2_9HYPO|nr:hypothetical protein B0I35DRAFT_482173 [Stachybotrys elegans]
MSAGPDLLFGIDVGMSCTGIAYINRARGNNSVQTFNQWPGQRVEDKVPTRLAYQNATSKPSSWGFQCDSDHSATVREWFKIEFGKQDIPQGPVNGLYRDFLVCLYEMMTSEFEPEVLNGKRWDDAVIHFLFSVPATWSEDTVAKFRTIAHQAGFGRCPRHEVRTSLTEPHAIAAYTMAEEQFIKDNENIMIVDAGGIDCGATYIDADFERLLENKLQKLVQHLDMPPKHAAWKMRSSEHFQSNKKELGSNRWKADDIFLIQIPGLRYPMTDDSLGVRGGELQIHWYEVQNLFDTQVSRITRLMVEIMDRLCRSKQNRFGKIGDTIHDGKTIQYKYYVEFDTELDTSMRKARIPIMTTLATDIPIFDEHGIVRSHTTLEADLSQVSQKNISQKHAIFSRSRKKNSVQVFFLIEAEVGVADVKFRCLDCQTNRQLSDNTAIEIEVDKNMELMRASALVRED